MSNSGQWCNSVRCVKCVLYFFLITMCPPCYSKLLHLIKTKDITVTPLVIYGVYEYKLVFPL